MRCFASFFSFESFGFVVVVLCGGRALLTLLCNRSRRALVLLFTGTGVSSRGSAGGIAKPVPSATWLSFLIVVTVRTPLLGCACAPTVFPSATFENSDPAGGCAVTGSAPRPGRTAAVAPRALDMQRGRGCFPRPPCQVFRNHLVFPESAGIFQRFKMYRWIECPENEPADLDAMCGHLMCSQDIEDNGSAGSRSKIQSVCSGNHTHSSITCDLSPIPQCVSALLAK